MATVIVLVLLALFMVALVVLSVRHDGWDILWLWLISFTFATFCLCGVKLLTGEWTF